MNFISVSLRPLRPCGPLPKLDSSATTFAPSRTLVLRGHEEAVVEAAFSPDGKHVVTASVDRTARVWNADGTGEPLILRGSDSPVYSAAFSPDGKRIVTASGDAVVRVWPDIDLLPPDDPKLWAATTYC